jgi:hypothetical protein
VTCRCLRGAQPAIWHWAALGLMDRIETYFANGRPRARHSWRQNEVAIAFGARAMVDSAQTPSISWIAAPS